MSDKNYNIKDRILQYVDFKQLNKEFFFRSIDNTSANYRGVAKGRALSSDTIEIIITKYPDLSPFWLLTGKGEMLLHSEERLKKNENSKNNSFEQLTEMLNDKKQIIKLLENELRVKEELIKEKDAMIQLQLKELFNKIDESEERLEKNKERLAERNNETTQKIKEYNESRKKEVLKKNLK